MPVAGLADHLEVGDAGAASARRPAPEGRVVVGDERSRIMVGDQLGVGGRQRQDRAHERPPSVRLLIVHVPPSSAARSRIEVQPTPPVVHGDGAVAVVGHAQLQRPPSTAISTRHRVGAGVPDDVGQRLRGDPVRRDLDRRRQRGEVGGR